MNMTTFFYCHCGYEKALTEGEDYVIIQCAHCFDLSSAKKKIIYTLHCSACDHAKKITGDVSFEKEETCENCQLKGKIGMKEIHQDALFTIENEIVVEGDCARCRKNEWIDPEKTNFSCPNCRKKLHQKMSSVWEED